MKYTVELIIEEIFINGGTRTTRSIKYKDKNLFCVTLKWSKFINTNYIYINQYLLLEIKIKSYHMSKNHHMLI